MTRWEYEGDLPLGSLSNFQNRYRGLVAKNKRHHLIFLTHEFTCLKTGKVNVFYCNYKGEELIPVQSFQIRDWNGPSFNY